MMLHVLGSGSKGNCYLLTSRKETLVIEAGIPFKNVKKALGFKIDNVVGVIVSHSHKDHAGYVKEFAAAGIRVMALGETLAETGMSDNPFAKEIKPVLGYKVGGFKVRPLYAVHDVECAAFIIEHSDFGRLMFCTDSVFFHYKTPPLSTIMIEANYADDILNANIQSGRVPLSSRQRILNSHMSIKEAKRAIKSQKKLQDVMNIILLHLSDSNSDEERFVNEVKDYLKNKTQANVYAANKGLKVKLQQLPF